MVATDDAVVLVLLAAEVTRALALAEMDGDEAASLTVAAAAKLARDGSGRRVLLAWCRVQRGWIMAEEVICSPRIDWYRTGSRARTLYI